MVLRPPSAVGAWRFHALVLLLSACAVMTLFGWGSGIFANFLESRDPAARWPLDLAFLIDWMAMCIAMMLPTALPLLSAVERLSAREKQAVLPWISALGFLAVWLVFGLCLRLIAVSAAGSDVLAGFIFMHQRVLFGLLLITAGAYALSPLATRCSSACRSPTGFVATLWRGGRGVVDAWRIGWAYGLSCFGCCWPQMAVLSLIGMANPFWMVLAALAMSAQKSQRYGRATEIALAAVLIGLGCLTLAARITPQFEPMLWQSIGAICHVG